MALEVKKRKKFQFITLKLRPRGEFKLVEAPLAQYEPPNSNAEEFIND